MAQGQSLDTTRHVIASAIAAVSPGEIVTDGDIFGFAAADADAGDRLVLQVAGTQYTESVVAGEAWAAGQTLYYMPVSGLITRKVQDWQIGVADSAKLATALGGVVRLHNPIRSSELTVTIKYAAHSALQADGDYVLRDFTGIGAGTKTITEFVIHHDANGNPATATIALGDGTNDNDQILAATPVGGAGGLDASGLEAVTLSAPVSLDKIVLRTAGGPITAGVLRFFATLLDD